MAQQKRVGHGALLKRGGFTNEARRFKRHADSVYYELTLEVFK